MILILKENCPKNEIAALETMFAAKEIETHVSQGKQCTIVGLVGDTLKLDEDYLRSLPMVRDVRRVTEPFKAANRKMHPQDTIVNVNGVQVGEGFFQVMSGPCSVESEEQIIKVAKAVQESGATILRGGAFKPRTSPYAFQGLKADGIKLLLEAKAATGLPIVTEIMNLEYLPLFEEVDVIQVGARNMQNFDLLRELGKSQKPVLLKRGLANTIEEFLMSAEYIMAGGNENVILCERGIRTFETQTRNTLDLSGVAVLKKLTHLPIIVDPSHATGISWMVEPMAKAAIAVGADGLMIETHNDPTNALCDGAQSLDLPQFEALMQDVKRRVAFEGKQLG